MAQQSTVEQSCVWRWTCQKPDWFAILSKVILVQQGSFTKVDLLITRKTLCHRVCAWNLFLKGCSQLERRQGSIWTSTTWVMRDTIDYRVRVKNWFIASDMWSEVSICTVRTNWLEPNHVLSHVSVKDMVWILTLRERDSTQTHLPFSEARGMRYHMKLGSRNRCLPELRRGR